MKRAEAKNHALVIVDVQHVFGVPPELVRRIRRYAQGFSRRVFTQFVHRPGSLYCRKMAEHPCDPTRDEERLVIAPQRGDLVLRKSGYGLRAGHIRRLRRAGIKRVTVCGIDTDACVMGVMFSLFDAGIVPRLKENLCWSSSGLHRPAVRILCEQFPPPK